MSETLYLTRPLLDIRPDFSKPKAGVLDDFSFVSEGFGKGTPWKVTSGPKRTATMDFTFGTVEETKAFRKFFSDRRGRRRGFWLPMWLDEYRIQLDAAAGSTTIRVEKSELRAARLAWGSFDHLVLATWDKLECYEIDSVADSGDHETITLTSPITSDLVASQTIAGGLLWARLVDDRLTFRHRNDLVCTAQLKFIELPMEYAEEHEGEARFHAYRITRGALVWRYVNWGADVVMGGHTWYSSNITHSSIKSGIEFLPDPVDVDVATDDPDHPFRYFTDRLNQQATTVEILEADADTLTLGDDPLFVGRIEKVPYRDKGKITAKLSSMFRYAEQPFPQLQATRLCNNQLFDDLCGLSEGAFRTIGTITALDDTIVLPYVEADEFGAKATLEGDSNWFALGKVTAGLEIRMCVGQDGNRLYLNAPFRAAVTSDSVSATAGCDKRIGTCIGKFDNLDHHWGFPYIPNSNPNLDELMNPKPVGGKK